MSQPLSQPLSDEGDEEKVGIAISLLDDAGGDETGEWSRVLRLSMRQPRQRASDGSGSAPWSLCTSDEESGGEEPQTRRAQRRERPAPNDPRPVVGLA